MSWYNYLNPNGGVQMTPTTFVQEVLDVNALRTASAYGTWLDKQANDVQKTLPSVQNITDGFFGTENEFSTLIEKYGKRITMRRR